jgi:hypothetical protein
MEVGMRPLSIPSLGTFLVVAALAPSLWAEGVVNVGKSASVSYARLQAAIDAASDGDVLLVANGTYQGFTIHDRSISIFPAPGAQVVIAGQVRVTGLAAHRSVVLAGLDVRPPEDPAGLVPITAFELLDNDGHVRVERCTGWGSQPGPTSQLLDCGNGANVVACDCVVFASSWLKGGDGCYHCSLGCAHKGGEGLDARTSVVAVFDCELTGGFGGDDFFGCAGNGGDGLRCQDSLVWMAGSRSQGAGGGTIYFGNNQGGSGGHGVLIVTGTVHSLDNFLSGGPAGCGFLCQNNGAPGLPVSQGAGSFASWPGTARSIEAALALHDETSNSAVIQGEPGDWVWALSSGRPGLQVVPFLSGWWLVPFPARMPLLPLGTVPASGSLLAELPTAPVGTGLGGRVGFHQLYVYDALGAPWLAQPFHQLVLNRDGPPDCNVNGVIDYLDTLEDPSLDCNGNLLIDACEAAAGTVADCNRNLVPDACDIAAGTSTDFNEDGVPDECQPELTVWVDVAAPAGGNGSAGAPFQSIGAAVAAATPQHMLVMVRDGVYSGPLNRDLDFAGKSLLVKSVNGPAACSIDLAGVGRLASFDSGEGFPAGFQGFAIEGGRATAGGALIVVGSHAMLVDCRIQDCAAGDSPGGGAVWMIQGELTLRGCELVGNTASLGRGGAIWAGTGSTLNAIDSTLAHNLAREGGAISIQDGAQTTLTHCRFLANTAIAGEGGAVRIQRAAGPGQLTDFRAADCLFAGNAAAGRGGACALSGTPSGGWDTKARIAERTFADNAAGTQGGALHSGDGMETDVWNSVLWDNQASLGSQISMASSFTAGSGLDVTNVDVQGGQAGIHNPGGNSLTFGLSIDADPRFADPDGPDNDPSTLEDNDYSLAPVSPCIDRGHNTFGAIEVYDWYDLDGDDLLFEPIPFDLAWQKRRADVPTMPDLGVGTPPLIDGLLRAPALS